MSYVVLIPSLVTLLYFTLRDSIQIHPLYTNSISVRNVTHAEGFYCCRSTSLELLQNANSTLKIIFMEIFIVSIYSSFLKFRLICEQIQHFLPTSRPPRHYRSEIDKHKKIHCPSPTIKCISVRVVALIV